MKTNGNDRTKGNYYLGLDVGTNSVGWAVTDHDYNVLKFKGNAMWGARLFDEAQDASARRISRTNRRRLARRNQRLLLLELLFEEEVSKKDPAFFLRMKESSLWTEDRTDSSCRYALFNDPGFTDRDYHRRYPTIYHLRADLAASKEPHDIRLVYLALHHMIKSRGHFLYETADSGDQIRPLSDAFDDLRKTVEDEYGTDFLPVDLTGFLAALQRDDVGVITKQKLLKAAWGEIEETEGGISVSSALDLLAGKSGVKLAALFYDDSLESSEVNRVSLRADFEENYDSLYSVLEDRIDLLTQLKDLYDTARLSQMLQGCASISEAKIALYEKNRRDLRLLKTYVREAAPKKFKEVFVSKNSKLNNFAAYSGYRNRSGAYSCTQEEFCKYLGKTLPKYEGTDCEILRVFREIKDGVFLTKLKGPENGVIPYQLHRHELRMILSNASAYLPFLNRRDEDGYTVREKIEKIFEFRIPYYVGPLSRNAAHGWAVRFPGKERERVLPWSFEQVIDTESSSVGFISNLIGRCTYTGEPVLPKDSLLYSEYMLLNELNPLQVNGKPIDVEIKQVLIRDLFYRSRKPVTKKRIFQYLLSQGAIKAEDEISGVDDRIKTSLRSYHDFRTILEKTDDCEMVEEIIRHILIFGNDRNMLKRWLRRNTHGLDESDFAYICRLKYSEWGRLSKCFLTELFSADPEEGTGEAHTIMDLLRSTSYNLMQLLSDRFEFSRQAEAHREELFGTGRTLTEELDSMYIAPAVRRSIRQTLKIVDEIVDIEKSAPEKIFIEMARDNAQEVKGKRTESRKAKLQALYASCREEAADLLPRLEQEDDNRLRSDKLFLYYTQFGKCMYSGEEIDLDALMDGRLYDIDHIYPQSKIRDNSLDNRVVVKNVLNREKTNIYPINSDIRNKMKPFWALLLDNGMISRKKYDRLIRPIALTEEELSSFVARQLVETRQSTKALTVLLQQRYGETSRIVFSKAGNVSDFRHDYDLLKCREVNDLHHAKDAYLNIVVGNVYDTRFTKRFFANILHENYSLNRVFEYDVAGAWDKTETIKTVKRMMAKNNPIITRMPREVKGQLFDLQLMPASSGQLEKKRGLDINRYGGYNKLTGAFYFVAEHTEKKKRIHTIEPVYLYQQDLYKKNPKAYCKEVLHLEEPRIICREIRADSLLEIDGSRLYISGRTGNYYVCEHAYQLALGQDMEKMIKDLGKYVERCTARRQELPITDHDGITTEGNGKLYEAFLEKLKTSTYHRLLANMEKDLIGSRDAFYTKSLHDQALILLEILKAFRSNAQNANLSDLCGKGTVGRVLISKKLDGYASAFLVHQSPAGLYEYRENLLT